MYNLRTTKLEARDETSVDVVGCFHQRKTQIYKTELPEEYITARDAVRGPPAETGERGRTVHRRCRCCLRIIAVAAGWRAVCGLAATTAGGGQDLGQRPHEDHKVRPRPGAAEAQQREPRARAVASVRAAKSCTVGHDEI